MRGSTLTFHGDDGDLSTIFHEWFEATPLVAAELLSRLNEPLEIGHHPDFLIDRILTLGATCSDPLVIGPASQSLSIEQVQMQDGSGVKQTIHVTNDWLVGLRPGGHSSQGVLEPTVLTTSGDSEQALRLFKLLKKVVTSRSERIDAYWVLPNAFKQWRMGLRLKRGQFQAAYTDLVCRETV